MSAPVIPERAVLRDLHAIMRGFRYSPDQPRDPGGEGGGEWVDTGGGGGAATAIAERPAAEKKWIDHFEDGRWWGDQAGPWESAFTRGSIRHGEIYTVKSELRAAMEQWEPDLVRSATIVIDRPGEYSGADENALGLTVSPPGGHSLIVISPDAFRPERVAANIQGLGASAGRTPAQTTAQWVIAHEMAHHWVFTKYGGGPVLAKALGPAALAEISNITSYGHNGGPHEQFAEAVGMYVATGRVAGPATAKAFRDMGLLEALHATKDATADATKAYRGVPDAGGGTRRGGQAGSREAAAEGVAAALALMRGVRAWDESKHPRDPAGSDEGGEFAGGGGGGGGGGGKAVGIADLHARAVKMLARMAASDPDTEHGINYTSDGISISPLRTTATSTEWSREDLMHTVVNAHSHPSGGPASLADVLLLHKFDISEGIVVGREYTYTVRPPEGGWDALTRGDLIQLWRSSMEDYPIGERAQTNAERAASAARTHAFWSDFAHDTGISYERTETPQ